MWHFLLSWGWGQGPGVVGWDQVLQGKSWGWDCSASAQPCKSPAWPVATEEGGSYCHKLGGPLLESGLSLGSVWAEDV